MSVKAIGRSDKVEDILREAARVLKPGGRLVYFEEGKDGERLTQALKGSTLFKARRFGGWWGDGKTLHWCPTAAWAARA